jgi:GNAT superfamily N-acetyltransferase
MYSLSHLTTTPDEGLKSQILQMVVDYLTDISSVAIPASNPLYNLYQYGVGHEVHQYLDGMDGRRGIPAELLLATDPEAPDTVLGFALYLPVKDDPDACSLAYLAVAASHRRQGIGRALVQAMTARYPHAELACNPARVPVFEAMGFRLLSARGPQVLMNTRDYGTAGFVAVLDVAPIYRSLEVAQIHAYLLNQHGKRAMADAEKQRDRHLDQLTRQAQELVQARYRTLQ